MLLASPVVCESMFVGFRQYRVLVYNLSGSDGTCFSGSPTNRLTYLALKFDMFHAKCHSSLLQIARTAIHRCSETPYITFFTV